MANTPEKLILKKGFMWSFNEYVVRLGPYELGIMDGMDGFVLRDGNTRSIIIDASMLVNSYQFGAIDFHKDQIKKIDDDGSFHVVQVKKPKARKN